MIREKLDLQPIDTTIVFEMANNHFGSAEHGKRIIEEMSGLATTYGFPNAYMKFQLRNLDTYLKDPTGDDHYTKRFRETALSLEDFDGLCNHAIDNGLRVMVTAFDEDSVDHLLSVDYPYALKIASASAKYDPLLLSYIQENMEFGVPIFASTGGMTFPEIDLLLFQYLKRFSDIVLLHCVGKYPTPYDQENLDSITRMIQRYREQTFGRLVRIGYSGHENPSLHMVSATAVAMGAEVIERHVGVPTKDHPVLNDYSLEPSQVAEWLISIRTVKDVVGYRTYKGTYVEENRKLASLSRGYFSGVNVEKGQNVDFADIEAKFPSTLEERPSSLDIELSPFLISDVAKGDEIRTKVAPIRELLLSKNTYRLVAYYLRTVIGYLQELGIFPKDLLRLQVDAVELSHHYGLDRFLETGAMIFELSNEPEYSKKLVVTFPGQSHPEHYHPNKKETFFVLSGSLDVTLKTVSGEATYYPLNAGNRLTIPINYPHSFINRGSSISVVEEVATHAYREGSVYSDTTINERGLEGRKTRFDLTKVSLIDIL